MNAFLPETASKFFVNTGRSYDFFLQCMHYPC
jgi:hypothetical protein